MDSDEILKRFELERQVLSALNHPNIARLYDAGQTEDGLPYFTMEYIKGLPIDEYCDRRRLTIAERLQLFQHVCSGVQHAHRNLVVHRDIKPSNIIVTEEGVPKLLDFGIAKLLNPELAMFSGDPTAPELRVMTPEYASPEQVRGETITTASDVYSLGVLLYEMLTGHRPYHLKTRLRAEIERVICEQEPERPSTAISHAEEIITKSTTDGKGTKSITPETVSRSRSARLDQLRRQLAGDLDNIVLKAMRKEMQRRYTSVERLMEDIDRHRLGHPVSARPSSIGYRAAKFVNRNRVGVAMASLVLLTVIGGLAVGLLFQAAAASEARAAQAEARQEQMATQLELEQARADQREAEAERRAQNVRNLVQFFLGDFHDAVLRLDHSMEVRQLVVQNGLTFLEELAQEPGAEDDLRLQRELARAYERIGDVQGGVRGQRIGDFDGALESYQKALSIRERLLENVPDDPELRRELITSLIRVSDALDQLRRYEEVLPHFERIFVMLEQFADNDPDHVGSSRLMMIALNTLGRTFSRLEQDDDALEMNLRAYEIAQELYALNPDDDRYARDLGVSEINLADRYAVRGEHELALRHALQGLEIRSAMAERNPENTTYRFDVAVAHRPRPHR
jgi:eukaryotic-like serine/threonine-protein kinase